MSKRILDPIELIDELKADICRMPVPIRGIGPDDEEQIRCFIAGMKSTLRVVLHRLDVKKIALNA